ncbi:MAG TPA: flavodoxin-dependent (E)-4-hydroxy-3-methylbut-2-enyl-diphosphate synthase, partial [Chloroflexota bacterium]|nr:flavodoxin-dependent (E)-4-hydroxy-3-methylbut-2-enyl-diphosphate synthase [Chloroflexota bacterium]
MRRIEERFAPLVEKCKRLGRAMRIGTNHGSLSDRIMNRFGDTPLGMVESALEFAAICRKYEYHDLIFSMKASNPKVMIQAYRLLAARLDELGWDYPFHLGVTEAGNGEDGRIKSAIGIGSLLEDGIGDTIRVSLTEDPEYEVPVAFALARPYQPDGESSVKAQGSRDVASDGVGAVRLSAGARATESLPDLRRPYEYTRREAIPVAVGEIVLGTGQPVRVVHAIAGSLSKARDVIQRATALAEADGLVVARPDALSVQVAALDDLGVLQSLKEALASATFDLPLAVCVPADFAKLDRVIRSADLVCLSTGHAAAERGTHQLPASLEPALQTIAAARRPVLLEAVPDATDGDMAEAASAAVDRVLAAALLARAAGCANVILSVTTKETGLAIRTYRLLSSRLAQQNLAYPLHLVACPSGNPEDVLLRASVLLGSLLCDGIGDSIQVMGASREMSDTVRARLAFNILQAAGVRLSKTEYVACPSCGRTLFNLQDTTTRIQQKTGHLKGVKLAIMGCIVNGPGEMADA